MCIVQLSGHEPCSVIFYSQRGFKKSWMGPLVSHFHCWLHVRCHVFSSVLPILPLAGYWNELWVKVQLSLYGSFSLLSSFCLYVWCLNLWVLIHFLVKIDFNGKLLLHWLIQTLSLRRGVWSFSLKSLGRDTELCEQFRQVNRQLPGKHSLPLCASVMGETAEKKEEGKVDMPYCVTERRDRAEQSQLQRKRNDCF